ncbi:MAG: hypothetical protein S0880_22980 [Actinomycetota bacterium]|nr:hypothetical protein [Actinomycetota bacterium]
MSASAGHRESALPGPRGTAGYHTVLVVGATGSGKTSLVRHLIGTAGREPFPAVSRARTTIAETEVVMSPDPRWYAVATFRSEATVRTAIVENLVAATESIARGRPTHVVTHDLIDHTEQRIRLHHLLGDPGRTDDPREPYAGIVARLTPVARRCGTDVGAIEDDEVVRRLTDELLDAVRERLRSLWGGAYWPEDASWPTTWSCAADRREALFARILPLVSNDAAHFGALLTPLVDGIRLRGPFRPSFSANDPFLMVVDSEGLGHVTATATALPPELVDQLDRADRVVLVDNASMPIGAATLGALRQIVSSGHGRKLVVCFTHVDEVVGPDLPTFDARRMLLLDSLRQAKAHLAAEFGPSTARVLEDTIDERTFLLGSLHEGGTVAGAAERNAELHRLLARLRADERPTARTTVAASIERDALDAAVLSAIGRYRLAWLRRLGLRPPADVRPLHWRRLAALARRIADGGEGYDGILPAEELATLVVDAARRVIEEAAGPSDGADGGATAAAALGAMLDDVATEATRRLRTQARNHLFVARHGTWEAVCGLAGTGSAADRAQRVWDEVFDAELGLDVPAPLLIECVAAVRAAAAHAGFRVDDGLEPTATTLAEPTIPPPTGLDPDPVGDDGGPAPVDEAGDADPVGDDGPGADGVAQLDASEPDRAADTADQARAPGGGADADASAKVEAHAGDRTTDGAPDDQVDRKDDAGGPTDAAGPATAVATVPSTSASDRPPRPLNETVDAILAAVDRTAATEPRPTDADPLLVERWVRTRLTGARLVAEIGIDRGLHALLAEAMGRLLERSTVSKAVHSHPNLLVAHLAAEGVFHYEDGTLYPNLCVPRARRAGVNAGKAFEEAVRALGLETFDDLVLGERALRYVTPILAHGGVPASSLDELFALIGREVERGATSGDELLVAWRACPSRFGQVDKPVERFLLGAGELGRDLLDRILDLTAEAARSNDPDELATAVGLPTYVCEAYLDGPRRVPPLARRAAHPPFVELDPYDGVGPRVVLPATDARHEDSSWALHDGRRPRRLEPSAQQSQVVELSPARHWDVQRVGPDSGRWSFEGLGTPPVLLFDPTTGRLLPPSGISTDAVLALRPRGARTDVTIAGAAAGSGDPVPLDELLEEELPDQVGAWSGYRVDRLRVDGLRALVIEMAGEDGAAQLRVPVQDARSRARLATEPVPRVHTGEGLPVLAAWPVIALPDGWERRPPVVRVIADGVDHVLEPLALRVGEDRIDLTRAKLPPLATNARLIVRGTFGADLRTELAVVDGLDVGVPDRVGLPRQPEPTVTVAAAERVALGAAPAGEALTLRTAAGDHRVPVTARHGDRGCDLVVTVDKLVWSVHGEGRPEGFAQRVVDLESAEVADGSASAVLVRLGRAGIETQLFLQAGGRTLQELPARRTVGRDGTWLFDLRRFSDTLATSPASSHQLILRVGAEPVEIARIRATVGRRPDAVHVTATSGSTKLVVELADRRPLADRVVRVWSRHRPWAPPLVRPVPDDVDDLVELTASSAELPAGDYLVDVAVDDGWTAPTRPTPDRACEVRVGGRADWRRDIDEAGDDPIVELERAIALGDRRPRLGPDQLARIAPETMRALGVLLREAVGAPTSRSFDVLATLAAGALTEAPHTAVEAIEDGVLDDRTVTLASVVLAPRIVRRPFAALDDEVMVRLWAAAPALAAQLELRQPLSRDAADRCERFCGWRPNLAGADPSPAAGEPVDNAALGRNRAGLDALRRAMDLAPSPWLALDTLVGAHLEWLGNRAAEPDRVDGWWRTWRSLDPPTHRALAAHLRAHRPDEGTLDTAGIPLAVLSAAAWVVTDDGPTTEAVRALWEASAWAPRLVTRDLVLASALLRTERVACAPGPDGANGEVVG